MDTTQDDLEEAVVAADLVGRIRGGDPAAEHDLVRRYGERLRYVLQRQMAAYPQDVDDVIQETLTITIERLRGEGIQDAARLGGFIYGIAKNMRSTKLREHVRHDGDVDPDVIGELPDDQIAPDRIVAGGETVQLVRRLLAELGNARGRERDREVLIRLYIRQQSREEICNALGIAPEHLRRVTHRAKRRLKLLLLDAVAADGPEASLES